MAPFLLHGDINATIYETQKFDTFSSVPLYASIYLDEVKIETRRLKEPNNPKLEECFYIGCAHIASNIVVKLERDKWLSSVRGRGVIGEAYVEVDEKMLNGVEVDKWVEIVDASKRPISGGPKIHIKLQFFDAKRHQNWSQGIKSPDFPGVPRTFFSQHKGCKVTLYQDVHVLDDFSPRVVLDGGKTYEPQRCWEDIFDAINEAKHLIYITGWSLYTQISLIRDPKRPKHGGDITLGELLKKKAKEDGVKVVLLLWQDGIISVPGIGNYVRTQGTHDKETQSYFKDTNVHCILCPRDSVFYTHHQKIVVVDTKLPNGKDSDHQRRIVSFIGGIDLCNGRYDTQFHSLFQTLAVEHSKDFYQPTTNPDDDDDTWNVQLFRSIDDTTTLGFPETAKEAFEHGLVSGENKMIDRSIQDAYINAIRRAKNFIYIENQYFIGSAFGWSVDSTEFDAVHLIPKELSVKIVSKIKAKEKFMVYVVIPMWPEGVPINNTTGAVQKILYL
ncbi:hypothetical protein Ahy_A01g003944 isoform C [Arachis hypogaea]|uniref:Phospholipase D alpha 1 n=1 Tax=Arachis hypogaea TaxID=3818 RepID=A0A445EUA2_ARAHY|nr:hypothetical protein Ahy_A01g003944 isoform C [Arachis hypogaea]